MKLYHDSHEKIYRDPFGAAPAGSPVKLAIRLIPEEGETPDMIEGVRLRLWQDEAGESLVDMHLTWDRAEGFLYESEITLPETPCLVWYYFIARIRGCDVFYGNVSGKGGAGGFRDKEPESYQITVYEEAPVPEWYKDAVVYQIFPDRFARDAGWKERCDREAELQRGRGGQGKFVEKDWTRPAYYVKDEEGNVTDWPFYGGSLRGIEENLDRLKSIGVTAVYINPIFEAASNHRYDTGDYTKIDPMLGTEDDFRSLAEAAGRRGIRLILDGVFSHTGADSLYFDKYGNYGGKGAFGNEHSAYRDWYEFREDDPVGYRCWWGIRDLPEVNETEESYRQMICGDYGVLDKWLEAGASGWRLDVADELPDAFISEIRHRIKSRGEDNVLLGEVWEDASNKVSYGKRRKYLMGDGLDGTMNYPLRDMLIGFALRETGASELGAGIMSLAENYPRENFYGALNLLGSHDRQRILSAMGAGEDRGRAVARVKMLSCLQFFLPGVPCIYYGDEAGMTGGTDPDNRNGYPWGGEDQQLLFHYRQLGVLYGEHPVLKSGTLKFIETGDDDILCFVRGGEDESILVAANRSGDAKRIARDRLSGIEAGYALELLASEVIGTDGGSISEDVEIAGHGAVAVLLRKEAPEGPEMTRSAGVICHISSIPGGRLGKPARQFADYLRSAGLRLWQVLPLDPPGLGGSPYSSNAAFAGDPRLINDEELPDMTGFRTFCEENSYWLDDYAAYVSNKETGRPDDAAVLERVWKEQYYFCVQWQQLREYVNGLGIEIIGDLPVYVTEDSADVEANRELFRIDEDGRLRLHAGVPPDYFSPEGQDWGNPLYDWDAMKADGYRWWRERLRQCFSRYDWVRLDHFRSFSEYFAIPEGQTPAQGTWLHGPGLGFFKAMEAEAGEDGRLRILAEDLGMMDPGVYNLLKLTGFPGMKVWQFSEDEIKNMPPEEAGRRVFYTGTHDNQPLMGWCRERGLGYGDALDIIRTLYESDAPWVIMQLQDMFMMGDEARMNVPGVAEGNWTWHLEGETMADSVKHADKIAAGFRILAVETGRIQRTGEPVREEKL